MKVRTQSHSWETVMGRICVEEEYGAKKVRGKVSPVSALKLNPVELFPLGSAHIEVLYLNEADSGQL